MEGIGESALQYDPDYYKYRSDRVSFNFVYVGNDPDII